MAFFGKHFLKSKKVKKQRPVQKWKIQPKHPELFIANLKLFPKSPVLAFQCKSTHKILLPETLIIGRQDVQSGYLLEKMKLLNLSFLYLDWDEMAFEAKIAFSQTGAATLTMNGKHVDLAKVRRVFVTLPFIEAALEGRYTLTQSEQIQLTRWMDLFKQLPNILPLAKFYPCRPRDLGSLAQDRVSDRILAQSLGLKIPKFLFSNDPARLREFNKQMKSGILFRELDQHHLFDRKHRPLSFRMQKITEHNLKQTHLKTLKHAPCYFEEYIDKIYEVRAYVVGRKVLSCRIDSQQSLKAKHDWREYDFDQVKFAAMRLPAPISRALLSFAKQREMHFASFDLIFSKSKNFYFLEMNRPGAWAYIEGLSGLPIAESIALELTP